MVLVVVLTAVAGWLVWDSVSRPDPVSDPGADPARDPAVGTGAGSPAPRPPNDPAVPARPADAQPMTVRYVYDGDTLQLQARQPGAYVDTTAKVRVRLIGIDTPEVHPETECFGPQAAERMRVLAPVSSQLWVAPDKDSWDRYGRRLFFVWTPQGRMLNYDLVADGYAEAIRVRPNVTLWPLLQRAGAQAKTAKRGIWGAC